MSEHPTAPRPDDAAKVDAQDAGTPTVDAERYDPEHARSEEAAETPPQDDAERMESALREGGPIPVGSDERAARSQREQSTEPGPGTSLT